MGESGDREPETKRRDHRSTLRTMWLVILVCQLGLILRTEAQTPPECINSPTNRPPENTDITVECGTQYMSVSIFLCPVYQALYNESLMVPNHQINTPECLGTPDWTAVPPVLRFRFSLIQTAASSCKNTFTLFTPVPSGEMWDYQPVTFVNVSGSINSPIMYTWYCFYPTHYVLDAMSVARVAVRDNKEHQLSDSVFDVSSSLSCCSGPLMAITICNVIVSMLFSI